MKLVVLAGTVLAFLTTVPATSNAGQSESVKVPVISESPLQEGPEEWREVKVPVKNRGPASVREPTPAEKRILKDRSTSPPRPKLETEMRNNPEI